MHGFNHYVPYYHSEHLPWFVVIMQSACQLWDTGTLLKPVEFWLLMIQNQAPNLVFNTLQQLYGPKNSFVH